MFYFRVANGSFSIAAIATMMQLANEENLKLRELELAYGGITSDCLYAGGFLGAVSSDIVRSFINDIGSAYAIVFVESILFLLAAKIAKDIQIKNKFQMTWLKIQT